MPELSWILLVEDEPDHRLLVKEALGRLAPSVPVTEMENVRDATRWLRERRADPSSLDSGLVVLDLGLPGQPGFHLLEWMRDVEQLRRVPVVVLTASENPLDAEHAFNLGAKGYFQKPADFRRYLGIFERVFKVAAEARDGGGGREAGNEA